MTWLSSNMMQRSGISGTENLPYRDGVQSVPVEEYEKARKEIDRLTKIIEFNNKMSRISEFFNKLVFSFVPRAAVIAAVLYAIWFLAIRGEANGINARNNAEREAKIFARYHFGIENARVYCQTDGSRNRKICSIYNGSESRYIQASCSTDYPVTNNGCYRIATNSQEDRPVNRPSARIRIIGPNGETIGYVADAGS